MEKNVKSSAINYGLYLGVILAIGTAIPYAVNIGLLANMWYGITLLIIMLVLGIISVAKAKGLLNGFISFKEAFTSYFITVVIGILISTVVSFVLFNIIDPEAAVELKKITIENTITGMERWGVPAEAIAETVDAMEDQNDYSIGNIAKGLGFYIILFSILGLIIAAIMKRNDPDKA
ncbi:MAG: DUF4199 domain-containing protein [Bacteroidia bacterium]|nr:DUF4199 domain-containing protein [Bacteroidia bacterium]NND25061.1 DUF4199 domain-containing protein [Flavobacteriaceae bacterium]MBT8279399.1 DUF4199 domain-containing protein [Bacteroidia bacterium]NNK59385.1 DUF4199 domain-containing protein [Flavobacteriaceae bacterium]NNL33807.1 DUF4199 domain-containing protein [Flavobacteriaceae bacterium]